jgi:hypothetical protein
LHGGSISLRSEINRGTEVTVILPGTRISGMPAPGLPNEAASQAA